MSEKNFKQTKVAALVLVALLVIVAAVIAVISTFSQAAPYQYQTPQVQTVYTQQPSYPSSQLSKTDQEDRARVMEEDFKRKEMMYGDVPPCVDPCNVRVEYTKQYFLPYPRYTVDHYSYKPYPMYPHQVPEYYPIYQRFFHHRVVEQEFGY